MSTKISAKEQINISQPIRSAWGRRGSNTRPTTSLHTPKPRQTRGRGRRARSPSTQATREAACLGRRLPWTSEGADVRAGDEALVDLLLVVFVVGHAITCCLWPHRNVCRMCRHIRLPATPRCPPLPAMPRCPARPPMCLVLISIPDCELKIFLTRSGSGPERSRSSFQATQSSAIAQYGVCLDE